MRRLKLRYLISEGSESNTIGEIFKEFLNRNNEEDNFSISDHKLNLSIVFESSSEKIITLISELPFSKVDLLKVEEIENEDENSSEEESDDKLGATSQTEPAKLPVTSTLEEKRGTSDDEAPDTRNAETKTPSKKRPYSRKKEEADEVGKKFFEEEAKKAKSYDELLENIGRRLEITPKSWDFYTNLAKAVCKLDVVSTNSVAECMDEYRENIFETKRTTVNSKIKNFFSALGSNVRFLSFFEEIRKYENYDFDGNHGDENASKVVPFNEIVQGQEFEVLSEDLLAEVEALGDVDFSSKVGFIFDKIKTSSNEDFYKENRNEIISVVTSTAEDFCAEKCSFPPLSTNSKKIFGDNSNFAVAFILQTIKNYCETKGIRELLKDGTVRFFADLIRLM